MGKKHRLVLIICLIFFLYLSYQYAGSFTYYLDMQCELENLEEKQADLIEEKQMLEEMLTRVDSQEYIEKIAREELGLVKEGEVLLIFIDD